MVVLLSHREGLIKEDLVTSVEDLMVTEYKLPPSSYISIIAFIFLKEESSFFDFMDFEMSGIRLTVYR